MEAILENTFAKVRAIVDERLSLREARRKAAESRSMRCASDKFAGAGPCSAMEPDVSEQLFEARGAEAQMCVSRRFAASYSCDRARLPEGLPVPSVEPRLPNLTAINLSFAARLVIAVRDKFKGDAPKVYTAAGVTRQAYSQIVSDETRPVSKRTAIRFAFALHSTPEEARALLKSAGYAFSNSRTEDFILQACLEVDPPIWDFVHVNELLREYRVDFQY